MPVKVLIIKLGYSETLDPEIGKVPSLGDVLRTTPLLWAVKEKHPDAHITWLVTSNAELLLQNNPLIDRLLVWDEFVPFQLMREKFDILINLEKIAGVCALADMVEAWTKYGFRFETVSGLYHGYEKGLDFMSYIANKKSDCAKGYWQQVLIEMMGGTWKAQPYIIGYQSKGNELFDFGFNYEVGSKWPVKGMDMALWKQLEAKLVARGFTVSWQEGKNDITEYMMWLDSCRAIISNDSLGMHLAMALNKKCVGLFGTTDPSEIFFYPGSTHVVSDTDCPRMPCFGSSCATGLNCMRHVDVDGIIRALESLDCSGDRLYLNAA